MSHQESFGLLVIVMAGLVLPLAARRLRLPAMILEIGFGMTLAQLGFRDAFSGQWLPFLAEFGFLMLMFVAGLEIDFTAISAEPPRRLVVYLLVFVSTFLLSLAASKVMGHGVFLALVLSTTSLGLVLPALRETGLSKKPMGQTALVSATMADFLTLFFLTGLVLYHDYGIGWHMVRPMPVFLLFGAVLWAVKLWAWWYPERAVALTGESDPMELSVRAAMALLFIFVAMAEFMGMEPILGAFLGGAVISWVFPEKRLLDEKLSGFAFGFLIPIFFIHVGIRFPLGALASRQTLLTSLALLVVAFVVKLGPSLFFCLRGLGLREALTVGLLLSARLSLIIAAAEIGVSKGLMKASLEPAVIVVALATSSLAPLVFKKVVGAMGYPEPGPIRQ